MPLLSGRNRPADLGNFLFVHRDSFCRWIVLYLQSEGGADRNKSVLRGLGLEIAVRVYAEELLKGADKVVHIVVGQPFRDL